jgi:hypothetical protein
MRKYTEIEMQQHSEICGNMNIWKYAETYGNIRKYSEIHENTLTYTEICGGIRKNTDIYRHMLKYSEYAEIPENIPKHADIFHTYCCISISVFPHLFCTLN